MHGVTGEGIGGGGERVWGALEKPLRVKAGTAGWRVLNCDYLITIIKIGENEMSCHCSLLMIHYNL